MKRFALAGLIVLSSCATSASATSHDTTPDPNHGPCELHTDGTHVGPCSILDDANYEVLWDPKTGSWLIEPKF